MPWRALPRACLNPVDTSMGCMGVHIFFVLASWYAILLRLQWYVAIIIGYYTNLTKSIKIDPWLLLYPPQVEHLWFWQKQPVTQQLSSVYATLMRPHKVKTAVCGSSIFICWMTGTLVPWPGVHFYWPVQVGIISSDYCHTSPYLTLGYSVTIPLLP